MTDKTVSIPSLDFLMNRGFRAVVHKVKVDPTSGRWTRDTDPSGFLYEDLAVRFDNWSMACIELDEPVGFGGLENWQESFEKKQFSTVARTIAIIEQQSKTDPKGSIIPDVEYAAMRMKDGAVTDYAVALTNALLLAQGVSPELVGEAAETSFREMAKERAKAEREMLVELHAKFDSPDDDTPTSPSSNQESSSISETGPNLSAP